MEDKVKKPKDLTTIEKPKKKTLVEALLETQAGQSLIEEYLKKKKKGLKCK